ncbi:MAG: hypothetical protein OHK0024_17170 [Thalassobaculales bacterium]
MSLPPDPFRIDWNTATDRQWNGLLARCHRPTLTQTFAHAMASAAIEGWRVDAGIIHFAGQPIGLVMVQWRKVMGLFQICRLDRGPLWLHPEIPGEMQKLVLVQIRRRYGPWRGRFLTFRPELPDRPEIRAQMKAAGFTRREEGYQTIWLDLGAEEAALRAGLRQNWRNALVQAERAGLTVEEDAQGRLIDWLLPLYEADRAERAYPGPSGRFLALWLKSGGGWRLYRALAGGEPVAAVLLLPHGRAATYQVGWTSPEGRRRRAHHLLLWQAALRLKAAGCRWLDLGGISAGRAPGVTRFKQGLGGEEVTLAGGYS